ncbi:MAG: MBL fold metallo-hydrolase [Hyphomicrobiaceae bacterium]
MDEIFTTAAGKLKFAVIPVTPLAQNCTLWWDDVSLEGVIIDPGGDLDHIQSVIMKAGMTPVKILLTHGHIDHAGGAADLKDKYDVEIHGPHIADKFLLEGMTRQTPQFGLRVRDVTPDRWLSDGDVVNVAGNPFEVRHCPGHTPGSVVFISHKHKLMVTGDTLLRGRIGSTDVAYANKAELIKSINARLLPLGDDYSFICGHGDGSSIGHERHTNPDLKDES